MSSIFILDIKFLLQELMSFVRSYVVPEGFPDSVTPSYVPYMTWRALKVLLLFRAFAYHVQDSYWKAFEKRKKFVKDKEGGEAEDLKKNFILKEL